ncbi:MAG: EAL domain-containing protein [Curvibacter lanceolatus]|uniref:sensor domain-containing protein n=1 Tax=Curvibacter lanceolatus TaxID=86182 RepID=UPI0003711252|nr:EAL domain-containing protein [Curvibacter lanceolatus]MBV5295711.1 EAL domain-containing protein [Curvibacter lanceolatus]
MTDAQAGPNLDGLLESVWLVEAAGLTLCWVNQAACVLLGHVAPEAVLGRPVTDLAVSPEDMVFWATVRPDEDPGLWSETLLRRPDGSVLPVERRVTVAKLPDGVLAYQVVMLDRSREQHAAHEFEQLVAELRATLDSTADGMLVCSLRGEVRAFNRRFSQIWAIPEALHTRRDDDALHAHLLASVLDPVLYQSQLAELAASPDLQVSDTLLLKDGRVLERSCVTQISRGRAVGRVFSFRDITDQVAAQAELRRAAKVFECSLDAVFIATAEDVLMAVNPAFLRLAQADPGAETAGGAALWVGRAAGALFADPADPELLDRIRQRREQQGFWEGEVGLCRDDGSRCPVQLSWVQLHDERTGMRQSIGFFRDLTEQQAAQRRIEQLAYSDALTGLPNRLLLSQRVDFALNMARRHASSFAVFFLDLDRFKNINDSLGHQFGDRVLIQVADRIRSCLRDVDTLCRLGGDEFVLYLHDVDVAGAERVASRVLEALSRPFLQDDMNFSIGCSIGVAMYPGDGNTLDELIKQADTAMYEVKGAGRGHIRFYRPQMNVDMLSRMKLETALRQAIERQAFHLHYQPQLHLASGCLIGAEALIRWSDPERGAVSPGQFIPLAEESGLIVQIGAWVLAEAVRQATTWWRAGTPLQVSINVSALQFRQPDFVERVAQVLAQFGLPPALLELELTESILVQDADEVLQRLRALAGLGVHLAIDDFGTGYSSLAYLKKFPISKLKIDQSFVRGLPGDDSDVAIVAAMIGLARALKLSVIAEGVETEAQRAALQQLGCDEYQGYLFSPGVTAAQFSGFLQGGATNA